MPKKINTKTKKSTKVSLIYGKNPVELLLKNQPARIKILYVVSEEKYLANINLAKSLGISIEHVKPEKITSWFSADSHRDVVHQGIAAKIIPTNILQNNQEIKEFLAQLDNKSSACILILENITDPQNLGACLRVANAVGVDLVIITSSNSADYTATVCKASSGAGEFVKLARISNLSQVVNILKDAGFWIYGTSGDAEAKNLFAEHFSPRAAIIMGAEGLGLKDKTLQNCDYIVKIPMYGVVPSLNVATATAVCLYEFKRQNQEGH